MSFAPGRGTVLSRWRRIDPVAVLLLGAYAVLALSSLVVKSPTFDEPYHLYQGYRYLVTGDPSLRVEKHPPGVQAIAALPLRVANPPLPSGADEDPPTHSAMRSQIERFWNADGGAALRLFPRARAMIVILGVLLGALLYSGVRSLHGLGAARLALALFCFDPNLLAHGRLVTTDLGATLGCWASVLLLIHWSRRPSPGRAAAFGAVLGGALVAKFSCGVVVLSLPVLAAILLFGRAGAPRLRAVAGSGLVAGVIALGVVWAVHGFAFGPLSGEDAKLGGKRGEEARALAAHEVGPSLPAPSYFHGLDQNRRHVYERGHVAYLRGENSRAGWWWYFPYALLVKTPLPTLALILLGLASLFRLRPGREELALLAFAAIYLALAIRGAVNIGYRHILPVLPFLLVFAARVARPDVRDRLCAFPATSGARCRRALAVSLFVLPVALAVGTLRTHPHYLAYFNAAAGGSSRGIEHLAGSNLDWGQDLPGLAAWLRENEVDLVHFSYFGTVNPSHYGIRWLPLRLPPPDASGRVRTEQLEPGVYAVSASRLVELQTVGTGGLGVFLELEPAAVIGHSIHVYRIGEAGGA